MRLREFYVKFVFVWETLLRVDETYNAYLVLVALMAGISTPSDVSKQARLRDDHDRVMLADYQIVSPSER